MPATTLNFQQEQLHLDPSGALYWPAQRALIAADLHFEKATAAARQGSLLPPYDTHTTLQKLAQLIRRYNPAIMIFLGDSFHDAAGHGRLQNADRAQLLALSRQTHFIWVTGNHDPAPSGLPGEILPEWQQGIVCFRHQAEPRGGGVEISGHYHPKASIVTSARRITRPCFAAGQTRLILPAFGAFTGGLDVRAPAIAQLFPQGMEVFLLGRERLFGFRLAP